MAFEKQDQRYYSNPKLVELKSGQKNIVFKKLRLTSLWLNPQGSRELKKKDGTKWKIFLRLTLIYSRN